MSASPTVPDADLMLLAGKDNEDAFATLVQRYQDILLNFFLRKSVSYNDGQDLAQRTFLRLWQYRKRYTPANAKFTTFLFMVASQVAVDFFRSESSRKRMEDGLALHYEVTNAAVYEQSNSHDDEYEDVRMAVASLPQAHRDVVELGVYQDLPYEEVAKILDIPKGTVKSRMFNALRKLKEKLDGK